MHVCIFVNAATDTAKFPRLLNLVGFGMLPIDQNMTHQKERFFSQLVLSKMNKSTIEQKKNNKIIIVQFYLFIF